MLLVIASLFARCALAQLVTYDLCADSRDRLVRSMVDTSLSKIVDSADMQSRHVVRYNPGVLTSLNPKVRLFFFTHECARYALGYSPNSRTLRQEQAADCYAATTLVAESILDEQDIAEVQEVSAKFGDDVWRFLPGIRRPLELKECLAQRAAERRAPQSDAFKRCMNERIQGCMQDCIKNYGFPESQCRDLACNPDTGTNQNWATRCNR